jgi:hypothetical protein
MTIRGVQLVAGAGLAAAAAAGALAVVLFWDGGGTGPEPTVASPSGIDAYADLDPYRVHFGDTVTARVEVTVDRSRVDPSSIRVNTDFSPWRQTGPPTVLRRDGKSTTYLATTYTLRCLESYCTTADESAVQNFRAARVTYSAPRGGTSSGVTHTLQAAWPGVLVTARYAPPSASRSTSPKETRWQANLVSLPTATYRLSPWLIVALLLGGAVLLLAAAVGIALWSRPRTPRAPAVASAAPARPVIPALEYALALLEDPARVNGSGDQRRALELVADGLLHRGDRELGASARTLAWSRSVPRIEETTALARKARAALGRETRASAP